METQGELVDLEIVMIDGVDGVDEVDEYREIALLLQVTSITDCSITKVGFEI